MKRHAAGAALLSGLLLTACGGEPEAGDVTARQAATACACVNYSEDGVLLARLWPVGCALPVAPDGSFVRIPPCPPPEPWRPPSARAGHDPASPAQLP